MKKIILISILVLLLAISSFADAIKTSPGTFEIKAYKLDRAAGVTITIVDALTGSLNEITGSLNEIEEEEGLDINGYFTPGNAMSASKENVDDIAFAYRVSGNSAGKYTVSIKVTPFIEKIKNEIGEESNGKGVIAASYFLINETVRFLDSNKATTSDYQENVKGLKIADTDSDGTNKESIYLNSIGSEGYLYDGFEISGSSNGTNDFWIARGAVGFVVDSDTYEKVPEGIYKATITVTLQENSK